MIYPKFDPSSVKFSPAEGTPATLATTATKPKNVAELANVAAPPVHSKNSEADPLAHIPLGGRVVSGSNTAWADQMDYERAREMQRRGVPQSSAVAVAGLWSRSIPDVLAEHPKRWVQVLADGERLVAESSGGSLLASLLVKGWTLADVFGVDPSAPDMQSHRAGLVWNMRGCAVVETLSDNVMLDDGRRIAKPTDAKGREFIWRLWA